MPKKYAPVEIIAGGVADTRETFAGLYVKLHELRQEAAAYYYRAFVDTDKQAEPVERPVFHPAPPGFGGNELAVPARRVDLSRLTDAGLALYVFGVQSALAEGEDLARQIEVAEHDLERMLIAMDGTIVDLVTSQLRREAAHDHRTSAATETSQLQPWDVPVRQPGTENYL